MTTPVSGFTAQTPSRLIVGEGVVMLNYGLPGERALGATRGGNVFNPGSTYRDIEADKRRGMVKGMRVLDDVVPTIVANLIEISAENLMVALPGLRSSAALATETIVAQYVGVGTGAATAFNLGNTNIIAGTERVYTDAGAGNPVLVPSSGYTLTAATGAIVFAVAPANGVQITATYSRSTGGVATHDVLTIDDLAPGDYLTNVALVGNVNGKAEKIICIIKNAISDGGISLNLVSRGEPVIQVTFTGMYDPADMDASPYEIRYPRN